MECRAHSPRLTTGRDMYRRAFVGQESDQPRGGFNHTLPGVISDARMSPALVGHIKGRFCKYDTISGPSRRRLLN